MRIFTCPTCGETGHYAQTCPRDPARNLRDREFGRWTVVGDAVRDTKLRRWLWPCRCSCPARTEKLVADDVLRRGMSISCGCAPKGKPPGAPIHCANCGKPGHNITTCSAPKKTTSETRLCTSCGPTVGPISVLEFSPRNSRCRSCNTSYQNERNARLTESTIERPCVACGDPTRTYRGGRPICAGCDAERQRVYRAEAKADGRDFDRSHSLRADYGITTEQYAAIRASQGGRCAICRTDKPHPTDPRIQNFSVDHDHITGLALWAVGTPVQLGARPLRRLD